jgi:hypothetical protein
MRAMVRSTVESKTTQARHPREGGDPARGEAAFINAALRRTRPPPTRGWRIGDFGFGYKSIRSLLFSLALLAFLVRSLVPVGFMPERSANNTYPLVICSGYGPVTIHVTADKIPNAPAHGHESVPCPYALAFSLGTLVDHPELPLPPATEPVLADAETPLLLSTSAKSYFSHGPPERLA